MQHAKKASLNVLIRKDNLYEEIISAKFFSAILHC